MIPDELIEKAWRAYVWNSNTQAIRNEFNYPDLRGPTPPPPDTRQSMRAALEAVAHIIWNQGWGAGMSYVISLERGIDDDESVSNPYERNENA